MNYEHPELRDRLAAEYVLGTLHGGARRRFSTLLRSSPALQQAVEQWQERLMPMAEALTGPPPAADLWRNIEAKIQGQAGASAASSTSTSNVSASAPLTTTAPATTVSQPNTAVTPAGDSASHSSSSGSRDRSGYGNAGRPDSTSKSSRGTSRGSAADGASFAEWLSRLFGIRPWPALAMGVCLGIGAMLVVPLMKTSPTTVAQLPESYAGFLQNSKGQTQLLVSSLRHGSIVDIKVLQPQTLAADQRLVLWAIPSAASGGGAPFALGEIVASGKGRLTLSGTSEQLLSKVSELAVSLETRGATLPATPNQPFLLRGPCGKFW